MTHRAQPPAALGGFVVGVVLAAGAGSRFGGPKIGAAQGLWLGSAIAALREGGCDEVAVCMGAQVVDLPPGVVGIVVPGWAQGLDSSVGAALRHAENARAERVLLHLVDLPDVGAETVRRVLLSGSGPGHLARATYAGRPGHPVVVGRHHVAAMTATLAGDEGGRAYLRDHQVRTVECGDLATGRDIDTPSDRLDPSERQDP